MGNEVLTKLAKPYYDALPVALVPFHYDLLIKDISVEAESFTGKVIIHLNVEEDTDELHLNYRDLKISQDLISIKHNTNSLNQSINVKEVKEFKSKEYFVIKFDDKVIASENSTLIVSIDYEAIIQTNMAGFYKSGYQEDGVEKFMLSTQFEATDARRAFPCLDEPSLKATFVVQLIVKNELETLANVPVESTYSHDENLKLVTFEKTPIMSTYLVAWAVGEFEFIESFTKHVYYNDKPLPVRIYTTKGYLQDAEFALEIAPKIVDYFSDNFDIKYPLTKLDLIAVHSFSHNAMENWGLITYRSTALLYSETKSDPSYKKKVAYVVAHEIAHQWFGNLVTMQWWDELWLNEGFATWVGYTAVDYLFPEWDIFSVFVSESLEQALNLDGLINSHPIKVPVKDALEIDELFDDISYLKGGSTILMLSSYLGIKTFYKGVAHYLNKNKFGNATSKDLWDSISIVSGEPINEMMENWIKKIGFPIVNVEFEGNNLQITQSRYLNSGDVNDEDNQINWWIPLNISTGAGESDTLKSDDLVISTKTHTIKNFSISNHNEFFKFNKDTKGVYRVNYSPSILSNNILPFFDKLSIKDKIGIIADITSIAISGDKHTSTVTLLELIKSVVIDNNYLGEDYVVWLELGNIIGKLLSTFTGIDETLTKGLLNFARKIYHDISIKLLSVEPSASNFLETKLRSEILNQAGLLSIPKIQNYALELFEGSKDKNVSIDPSLQLFVFKTITSSPELINEENFNFIMQEIVNPTSLNSREIALESLGSIKNDHLSNKLITFLIDPNIIPIMDSHFLAIPLSLNVEIRDKFWIFFTENYDTFYKLMSTNMVVLDRFIKKTLKNYQSMEKYHEINSFFENKDTHGFERSYKQALDHIRINSTWFERDNKQVKKWLVENDFA